MSLALLLQSKFRGDIRFRGAAYLQAERLSITRVTPDHFYAIVRDGAEFQTQLSRINGDLKMFCSCVGEGQTREPACKHLWATILAVDNGQYLTSTPKTGAMPPFAAETPAPIMKLDPLWDDDDDGGDVYRPPVERPGEAPRALQLPVMRDWELRIKDLSGRLNGQKTEPREREIFYEIDLDESKQSGQLVVQTSQRERRSNGQWGKLKPLKVRPGKLDEIEQDDDRRILAYLMGGVPDRSNWHGQPAEFITSIFRYKLPYDLCLLILPLMCGSGRVRYQGESEKEHRHLRWDESHPWSLCMALRLDEAEQLWRLTGELRREKRRAEEAPATVTPPEKAAPVTDKKATDKTATEETEEKPPEFDVRLLKETLLILPGGLVLTKSRIARLEDFGTFEWVELLQGEQGITAKIGEEREFLDRLLDLPSLPQLDLPESLRLEEIHATPTPILTLKSPKMRGWRHERLPGNVDFEYLGTRVSASSGRWAIVQREQGRCVVRDRRFEGNSWSKLMQLGFRRLQDLQRGRHDVEIGVANLGIAVRQLITDGWQVRADGKEIRQPGVMQFKVKSGIDWFELSAKVDFGGRTVAFPELLSAISRGDNTIRLDDGSLGILPEEWLAQYGLLTGLGQSGVDHVRFAATQIGLIDALLTTQEYVEFDDRYLQIRDKLRNFKGITEHSDPLGFHGHLRPYQREGVGWLRFLQDFNFGGCLADDMGLGKTVQMLAILQERAKQRAEKMPSLVVVPKSLMFNWVQEMQRFTPDLTHLEYTGLERNINRDKLHEFDVVLTTYGTLRRDIMHLKDVRFDYAVLDEAQTIKNAASQVAKASRLLQAQNRLALSGTPIENHLGDLWSIFEFLNPGMLGRSSVFKMHALDAKDAEARKLLSQGLRPFFLRRTKKEVAADLPSKFEETIYCQMGKRQRALYDELREHYRESLLGMVKTQGLAKSKMHVLEALLRLRQAACHPALLDRESAEEPFAKLDVLVPHLSELIEEGHKSLVFSQFTSMLSIVKKHLDAKGIKYAYLDGQTKKRKQVVEEFQNDPDTHVFLISLKAGGLGLNLTAAEYVFLLDPWWNPAVEAQAIDRAHRVGQTKQVFAYRLICKDTVEEKILDLQHKKRELADAILEADGNVLQNLTSDDLELLLS